MRRARHLGLPFRMAMGPRPHSGNTRVFFSTSIDRPIHLFKKKRKSVVVRVKIWSNDSLRIRSRGSRIMSTESAPDWLAWPVDGPRPPIRGFSFLLPRNGRVSPK